MIKEALYYEKIDNEKVKCNLCPHYCVIPYNKTGICLGRKAVKNENGELILATINYGSVTSVAIDPIEKKPLYHFYPGSNILSVGSFGCNFKCSFCQNYNISQQEVDYKMVRADELVEIIIKTEGNIGIAFTYNEPFMWYEYVLEVAKLLKDMAPHKRVVLVTNGYVNKEPLKNLLQYVDAMNIDLKGDDNYYRLLCKGRILPVLETIKTAHEYGCHIEITTLLVTKENTSVESMMIIRDFISKLDKNIPLHISRYFPNYKLKNDATDLDVMKLAYKLLKEKLNIVHVGNVSLSELKYIQNEN